MINLYSFFINCSLNKPSWPPVFLEFVCGPKNELWNSQDGRTTTFRSKPTKADCPLFLVNWKQIRSINFVQIMTTNWLVFKGVEKKQEACSRTIKDYLQIITNHHGTTFKIPYKEPCYLSYRVFNYSRAERMFLWSMSVYK